MSTTPADLSLTQLIEAAKLPLKPSLHLLTDPDPIGTLRQRLKSSHLHGQSAPPLSQIDSAILEAQELVRTPSDEPLYDLAHDSERLSLVEMASPKPAPAPAATSVMLTPKPPAPPKPKAEPISEVLLNTLRARPLSGIMRAQVARVLAQGLASNDRALMEEALGLLLTGQMTSEPS